ncbi:DUF2635 domain-containing protein [Haemophilus influenzae]|uniref:DUF2635 domain-containing protein n=1 Tax=Haemophilus influenzae TaxID=727 RepID=A0A2S9S7Z4_HAEIF|nr:DUF2635 domain-containing protein [Haemophilus influenzae]DAO37244.1 MAG TPA: Protein of unknown function (DUF2635) [Caudoviricetes sp.]AXP38818.1 DUF2635 domain-containing protein [Haemophilus influenzae]MBZ5690609.1 DUF2635 domain-containing protein [Haemophilus influenzae]MCK8828757.1 DUF2635 domain-containing protein [Haemophilus influenzae]MCK8840150.1 DUF2635 domain-containing protein [Haemophilus influenzae]
MIVKAAPGVKVPLENQPYTYIEQEPVEVDDSVYYQRRIADSDLIEVQPTRKQRGAGND